MEAFSLCMALGPVAIYLLLLGAVNLSRFPLLVSGARDAATLALAVSGLVLIGPMELFVPFEAVVHFGPYVWVLLTALYAMCVALWLLMLRPRLVIYNVSADHVRSVLADVVGGLDAEARWAGDSLVLPALGVQLYMDSFASLHSMSLLSAGSRQHYAGWRKLENSLRVALAHEEVGRNPRGLVLIALGLLCVAAILLAIWHDPQAVARALLDFGQSLLKILRAIGL
jgi:hypothetical protein